MLHRAFARHQARLPDRREPTLPRPAWLNHRALDFEAKTYRPTTRADVEPLFQSFRAERFNLKMPTEPRMQALVLTVDVTGNKMTRNTTDYEWEIPV